MATAGRNPRDLAHRQGKDAARRGAERHPDAQLAGAPTYLVGDDSIDSDGGEQQRDGGTR
jgi:hypothetical protein